MLGAIFLHLLTKLLEIRDITLPAYARGFVGVKEWCFVSINRPAKTASLDHGLPPSLSPVGGILPLQYGKKFRKHPHLIKSAREEAS